MEAGRVAEGLAAWSACVPIWIHPSAWLRSGWRAWVGALVARRGREQGSVMTEARAPGTMMGAHDGRGGAVMSDGGRQVLEQVGRTLADVLAAIAADPDDAWLIATRAGFPPGWRPPFRRPEVFWSRVVEAAINGTLPLEALVREALVRYPHSVELREHEKRIKLASAPASVTASDSSPKRPANDRLTRLQFARLLDRSSPWGQLLDACDHPHHSVMWVEGDPGQNLDLFYRRIQSELHDRKTIDVFPFGGSLGDGATAHDWGDWMIDAVPGADHGLSLAEALGLAARSKPVMFLLDNQRGPLHEDKLSKPYAEELLRFLEHVFADAVASVDMLHPVRLFIAIQTPGRRRSRLAEKVREAVGRAIAKHGGALGKWDPGPIKAPSLDDVRSSMEKLLVHPQFLSSAELHELKVEYKGFSPRAGDDLRKLADRLFPLYERFYSARMGKQDR